MSFTTDNTGQFCSSGSFQELKPHIERDDVDLGQIPEAVRSYTECKGNRCEMPMLSDVHGLYCDKGMLAEAVERLHFEEVELGPARAVPAAGRGGGPSHAPALRVVLDVVLDVICDAPGGLEPRESPDVGTASHHGVTPW